jgi:hypothetical protein
MDRKGTVIAMRNSTGESRHGRLRLTDSMELDFIFPPAAVNF